MHFYLVNLDVHVVLRNEHSCGVCLYFIVFSSLCSQVFYFYVAEKDLLVAGIFFSKDGEIAEFATIPDFILT